LQRKKTDSEYNFDVTRIDYANNKFSPELTRNQFLPLEWKLWPYEGKLLFIFIITWCVFGLLILGSASWWVAVKEMGDWSYFLKRQIAWYIPGLSVFYLIINTNIRDLLKTSKIIFYILIFLIISTILFGFGGFFVTWAATMKDEYNKRLSVLATIASIIVFFIEFI